MTKIPFVLAGKAYHDFSFEGPNTIKLYVNEPDDSNWACINLGKCVQVERAGRTFGLGTAYVYSVCKPRHSRGSFTILVSWSA